MPSSCYLQHTPSDPDPDPDPQHVPSQVSILTRGSKIWVEDVDVAWIPAEVLEVHPQHVKAKIEKQKKTVVVSISRIYPRDVDALPRGEDDMTKLAYLHEPGVLHNLRSRYELNEIYTYTGNILIAVNPFVRLPHLYDSHMMQQYKGAIFGELNPHVFAISDSAYRAMISRNQNQAILVSGESGAGKTETTKLIMQYLAFVGGRTANDGRTVEQQVLESNPLLEAFGNAKTVRNDNSSRFGKFVEIQFNSAGKISGAAIRTYLLERSRVVQLNDQERNYHCFYQLCASNIDANRYKLLDPAQFHYLNQSNCFVLHGVDDGLEYARTRRAMDIVGISSEEQDAIFRTLAAILHLGNIQFKPGTEHDSSILKDERSYFHLQTVAELLMCDVENLKDTLCTRIILTHGEVIKKMLDPDAALTNRNTLSKTIYVHLFDWLVDKINKSIGQDKESQSQIGLLDIYGFESFPTNSFEQFCINLANEKLQQHFNEHALRMEQEEYNNEGIDWSYINYIDNQDVLELIEKRPMGIIALLDEACMFPKSTNETFATKLFHAFKDNERFRKPKLSTTDFIIYHYAGEVLYQTDFFLEKNKDFVIVEHQALLESSKDTFVSGLFTSRADHHMKPSYKFSSVATRFKQQLQLLMETLSLSEPHYIRCVKPNNDNKPGKFENMNVLHQLRCSGVLEAVRISCAGYPTRSTYDEFLNRFGFLASNIIRGYADKKVATEKFLEHLKIADYQLGVTKVFLRTGQMAELETHRAKVLNKAIKIIEHRAHAYLLRKRFLKIRRSVLCIQSHWRGYLDRKVYNAMRKEAATIFIQRAVRMWLAKKSFLALRKATIIVQKHARNFLAHKHQANTTQSEDDLKIQVKISQTEKEELQSIESTPLEIGNAEQAESSSMQAAFDEIKVSKTSEVAWLRVALAEMEKSKEKELQRLQITLVEVENSKTAELEKLRFALHDMEESKNADIRKLQAAVLEKEKSKTTELAMLQSRLQHIKETKAAEVSTLQRTLHQNEEKKQAELARMQNAVHQIEEAKQAESARLLMLNEQTQEFVEEKLKGLQNSILELEKSKQADLARIEATLAEMKMSRGAELERLQNALIEMEELKGTEIVRLQNTLLGMEESKKTDLAKLQAAVLQMEESKRTEMTRLQTAILQIKETKSIELASLESTLLQIRETHKVQLMETEKVHNEELTRLQNIVLEMKRSKQAELASMRAALIEMEESKGAELARLQKKLNRIEDSKKTELSKLRNALTEMEESKKKDLARLQAALHEIEESKREEIGRLKSTLHQMEETKSAELARLQNVLLEMQQQVEAMRILILNERETNKMLSIQLASLLKIRPLLEASEAKAYQLAKENGHLRILNDIHEDKALEAEKELLKARKDSEEILQKNKEAELKIDKVRETLQRLEEKMTFLEVENEVLRTQANAFSPSSQKDHVASIDKPTENGQKFDSESTCAAEQLVIKISPKDTNYQQDTTPERQSVTLADRKILFASPTQENQDMLVDWIVQDIGFSDEKPIVACTIYMCLLQWNAFQSERTNIFDRLAQAIGACIEAQESTDILAYWLSNISSLLRLGHQNMRPKEVPNTPSTPNTPRRLGLFGKITKSFRSPSLFKRHHVKRGLSSLDSLCQLEIKTPAVAFKQQLIVFVEKLYGLLRDNLKKEISPILTACIQAPKTSRAKGQQLGPFNVASFTHNLATTHWSRITECLNAVFIKLHANHVPPFFVCKIFTQMFSFINAQLFNSLLLRRECCSFTNGEYLKAGLAELETWLSEIPQQYAGDSWEELKLIRQAVAFLVIHQKPQRSYEEIRQDLCPNLSVQQLYRISTMYWDDKYGTHSVSQEVIGIMKKCMSEEPNKSSGSSFLLDDDSSIPFSLEEMLVSMPDIDPTPIQYPPAFQFDLHEGLTTPTR